MQKSDGNPSAFRRIDRAIYFGSLITRAYLSMKWNSLTDFPAPCASVSTHLLTMVLQFIFHLCGWVASGKHYNTRIRTSHAGRGMVKLRRHSTLLGRVPRVNSDEFAEFASRHAWTLHMMHIRLIPLRS